ncbi:hypothetical protein LTS14_001242 [Recurvomyces mirabilis]|uniref:uncharacterized protein n=1 Tax=Recurvomyces mirabilis TaxID=574656 RepID=UPI002DE05DF7|nr:hypothetical protein LTS14_001242 [Recurvomyces mirabilis]
MSRVGQHQEGGEICISDSPYELSNRRISVEQGFRGSVSSDAARGASVSSLDQYARSVSSPHKSTTASALGDKSPGHITAAYWGSREAAYCAAAASHAKNEDALRMSTLTLEPQTGVPAANTAISARDGTPRLSSSAALSGGPERQQDHSFTPPSSAGPSTYLAPTSQQTPPRPSRRHEQAIGQMTRHGAAVRSSALPTLADPAAAKGGVHKRVQAETTKPAGSGSIAPDPADFTLHTAKASPTSELTGAIPLDPQAVSHKALISKVPGSTGKAAQRSTKVLELITTNLDGSGSPLAEKGSVERAGKLKILSSNRMNVHDFCVSKRNLPHLRSLASSNRQSGNDDTHTSEKGASTTQYNTELSESSVRYGAYGGQRELSRKMMVACDSDTLAVDSYTLHPPTSFWPQLINTALEVGVYMEAWSEQVDVMKLTAAPRLIQLEECVADFNRIGQLLDARYGRAGGDGVFEEYNVELYVTVPCTMTDSDRARVRNNIRKSSFRSSVTILARVEAVAAPRLHWAFQNDFIHKGDTVLVLSCTVSSNNLGAYDISNPKFSYKEHAPPQDISGGWPKVEQDFREWLSWAFGASLDSVDPLLLGTHSEFMREFRSLYFLGDIKADPKYVHCLPLDIPHDDINRGYYDIRSDCVLVSKWVSSS